MNHRSPPGLPGSALAHLFVVSAFALACAAPPARGEAGRGQEDWVFSNCFEIDDEVPARVEIVPGLWQDAWVGARQQFTARVTNANGRPLPVAATWSTSGPAVAVTADGLATAMSPGGVHQVQAAAGPVTGAASLNIVHDGAASPELMYTTWFARTDKAPAILRNGDFKLAWLPGFYTAHARPTRPWPDNGRLDAANQPIDEVRATVARFQWEGNTIGLLTDVADGAGTFRVRERHGEWRTLVIGNAVDFRLRGARIAVLLADGSLIAKDGVSGPWVALTAAGAGVRAFQLEGDYIAVLQENGRLRIRQGLNGSFHTLTDIGSGASAFQVDGNHIAVLFDDGRLIIKDGMFGPWTTLASSGVDAFRIAVQAEPGGIYRPYIGVLRDGGDLYLKYTVNGPWSNAATGVVDLQIEANPHRDANDPRIHIGVLHADGRVRIKETHTGPWNMMAAAGSGVESFQLRNTMVALMHEDGRLRVRSGVQGTWVETPAYGPGVSQYDPLVSVPSPPYRTTLASYDREHARCQDQPQCYPFVHVVAPAPVYGRFCGAGVPHYWGWAVGQGPTDAMDMACKHHDLANHWYPEALNLTQFETCIVRYALRYSRLTQNGVLLTHGGDTDLGWALGWGTRMPALRAALDAYFPLLATSCPDFAVGPNNDLADFEVVTR